MIIKQQYLGLFVAVVVTLPRTVSLGYNIYSRSVSDHDNP